jgi:hypothetical protein
LRSVAYTNSLWGEGIYIYKLYIVRGRTERCATPARISPGADVSPSTETQFSFRKKLADKFN